MIHVLLAAYNEEEALGLVLEGVARTLADGNYRLWVVDDGSRDGTADVARVWAGRAPVTLVQHEKNAGLGAALRTGLAHVLPVIRDADVLVTLDADHTHPPALIPRLAEPIESGLADLVIASRFVAGAQVVGVPFFRRFTSAGARRLFRLLIPIAGVRDYTCGFRAYRGALLKEGHRKFGQLVTETGFAATAEWLVKLGTLSPRVLEIPMILRYDRKPTASKMPVLRTIGRTLGLLMRLKKIRTA